jgi:exopolyphosphatase / guanosine-5'-triphosphate,3'-diphosphate pyrophosphatase
MSHPLSSVDSTVAVIDIGTNTVLLLVARVDRTGQISTIEFQQRIPRLGRGVDDRKALQRDSMERVIGVLIEYRAIISGHNPDRIAVCGTSAVRDATNGGEFAALIKQKTGFELEVLSGEAEAHWTYRGALSGLPGVTAATVVDIGGGSTEITRGNASEITGKISLDIGSVRLTERFIKHDPPDASEIMALRNAVKDALRMVPPGIAMDESRLVGVAGTATSFALLAQERRTFHLEAVSGFILHRETLRGLVSKLQALSAAKILGTADYMEGRNDIITAGGIILEEVMDLLGADELAVSERGVRYGLAIREWERKQRS